MTLFVKKRERRRPHGFCALALLRKWAEKCLKINSYSVCSKSAFCLLEISILFARVSFGAISGYASGIRPSRQESGKRLGIFKKSEDEPEKARPLSFCVQRLNTATLRGAVIDAAKVRHFFESTKQFAFFLR